MLRRLNIRSKLLLTVALPLVLLIAVGLVAYPTFQAVKVNGPAYSKIKSLQDTRADVSPPKLYIVETQAEIARLLTSSGDDLTPERVQEITDKLASLEAQYRRQHEFWNKSLRDTQLAEMALVQAYTPVDAYFQTLNTEFLPAIESAVRLGYRLDAPGGSPGAASFEQARVVFREKLNPLYEQHRAAIDRVVERVKALLQSEETSAKSLIGRRLLLLVVIGILALFAAALLGSLVAQAISRPIRRLTDAANAASAEGLPRVVSEVQEGRTAEIVPVPVEGNDELAQLAKAFNAMQSTAVSLAAEQARVRKNVSENLVNLGRRNQVLLGRTLSFVTQLEETERDPKRLDELFRLDHLTTRMRRNAESLLVLAGAEPPRMWSEPVEIGDVVRAALSEIEEYRRVELTGMEPAKIQGAVVSDVAHLLAELLENATSFSPPTSKVSVLGKRRTDGYLIVIVDEGFGMSREELEQANRRLAEPASFDSTPTKVLGLHVVGKLAQRHGIRVELTESFAVGVAGRVLLPDTLFDAGISPARVDGPMIVSAPAPAALPSLPDGATTQAMSTLLAETSDELEALFNSPFSSPGDLPARPTPSRIPAGSNRDAVTAESTPKAPAPVELAPPAYASSAPERQESGVPAMSAHFEVPQARSQTAEPAMPTTAMPTTAMPTTAMPTTPSAPLPAVAMPSPPTPPAHAAPPAPSVPTDAPAPSLTARTRGASIGNTPLAAPATPSATRESGPTLTNLGLALQGAPTAPPAPPAATPPAAMAGLRRRVPGAQLPDTGPVASDTPDEVRDPGAIRSVLGGLQRGVEGARKAAEDSNAD